MSRLDEIASRTRSAGSRAAVAVRGMIRRMAVSLSAGGLWQTQGHEDEDSDDVPVFQGIGFASRPSAASVNAGNAEVVIVHVNGASGHPVIVATRDESIRFDIEEDETVIFNGSSQVRIRADGTIEVGAIGGSFEYLALKSDVDAVEAQLDSHQHTYNPGPSAPALTTGGAANVVITGTSKLKAD